MVTKAELSDTHHGKKKEEAPPAHLFHQAFANQHPGVARPLGHPGDGKPHPDKAHSDKAHPDKSHPDKSHPDKSHPDKSHPDKSHPDKSHPDKSHPDKAHPDKDHPGAKRDKHPHDIDDLTPKQQKQELKHEAFIKAGKNCHGMWTHMIGTMVTHNETTHKKFDSYTPNDVGRGISVGILQWNQKRGALPDLFRAWHHKDAAKFDHMFGQYSKDVLRNNFVKGADFNGNKVLHDAVMSGLKDPEFQGVQVSLRDKQTAHSCELAKDNGFKSFHGRALAADLANQMGAGGADHAMHKIKRHLPEARRIDMLEAATSWRPHGEDRADKIEDKVNKIWAKLGHSLLS